MFEASNRLVKRLATKRASREETADVNSETDDDVDDVYFNVMHATNDCSFADECRRYN